MYICVYLIIGNVVVKHLFLSIVIESVEGFSKVQPPYDIVCNHLLKLYYRSSFHLPRHYPKSSLLLPLFLSSPPQSFNTEGNMRLNLGWGKPG